MVAAWQVGAPDGAGKQGVAHEQVQAPFAPPRHFQAHTARAMPRRMVRTHLERAKRERVTRPVEVIDRRQVRIEAKPEPTRLFRRPVVDEEVVAVQRNRHTEHLLGTRHTRHVIHMRVGQQDEADCQVFLRDELEQPVHFVARVDEHRLTRVRAGDDEAVLVEGTDRLRLDYDHRVILAILDDLLFSSKIRSTAGHTGATVAFARSSQAALDQMRATPPSLVILDLNNPRTDPLGIVAAMKADPALATIRTVGYVSHVDTTTIEAARQVGVDVMARSAFVSALPELLRE